MFQGRPTYDDHMTLISVDEKDRRQHMCQSHYEARLDTSNASKSTIMVDSTSRGRNRQAVLRRPYSPKIDNLVFRFHTSVSGSDI